MSLAFYKVFITPLKNNTVYGDEVEVSDFVIAGGVGTIKQSVDSGNFDIGVYTYSNITLSLVNYDGRFNDETDSASMFYFTRDRAKVRIEYIDTVQGTNIVFDGIINDEASLQDLKKDFVKIRVLSKDSIIKKVSVPGGLINDGNNSVEALTALLNRPAITGTLNFNAGKISVGTNSIIGDATSFSDKNSRTVLEQLLNASGSVFYVDSSNDMVVSDRSVNIKANLELYGGGDPQQRDNITEIKKYNTGLQRMFNTFTVNGNSAADSNFSERYGANIKAYTFDFITSSDTEASIAVFLLSQFKIPKIEMEVVVKTEVAKDSEVLDPVVVSFQKRHKGFKGARVPLAGIAIAGTDISPYIIDGTKINSNKSFKITGILQDTKKFLTTLKLREV